tara:strand:+ start:1329 stop:2072 length:744 start_codon:yes stop_codon:yes gene_type:complete
MTGIQDWYAENPNVVIMANIDDVGQPYSCDQWGSSYQDFNEDIIPLITDDGNQDVIWSWLNTGSAFPSTAYIDHTMTVYYKANNPSFSTASNTIDSMLDECGDLCTLAPPEALFDFSVDGNTVTFIDFSELASEGWTIESWDWNFGDGNTSSEQNPVHTYDTDGTYETSLTITTNIGTSSEPYTASITINNFILGDLNSDGQLNILDILLLINLIFNSEYDESGDINENGNLNISDCILLVNLILGN